MTADIHQHRPKPGDSEKITINLGYIDLGQIDLMVQEGFYSNRTDFIRTAIRNQLERHAGWSGNSLRSQQQSGPRSAALQSRRSRSGT